MPLRLLLVIACLASAAIAADGDALDREIEASTLIRSGDTAPGFSCKTTDGRAFTLAAQKGKVVLLYSGNYGVAHDDQTVIAGYERHHRQGSGRVRLWLSATGGGADEVATRLSRRGLPFHKSAPVPLDRLAGLLLSPDAHLVALKDAFVGYVMPSKIYACVASGRPVLFVGSAVSDVDLLARESRADYWHVVCGDAAGFATALEGIADRARPQS